MKFSIITATYNRENTIERALKSIKKQKYKNIELVVIDGDSNDSSLSKIKSLLSYQDICISEKDKGIYDALNKGIFKSSGDIIGFLNSDDLYYDNLVIEKVYSIFKNTKVDVVYGDAIFFKNNNLDKIHRYYKSSPITQRNLAWGKMPAHTAVFIKRDIFERYGNFKINYKICADYEFFCRIAKSDLLNYEYIAEPLVKMSLGGVSTSGINNTILLNKEVLRACSENDIYTNIFMIFSKYPSKLLEFTNFGKKKYE